MPRNPPVVSTLLSKGGALSVSRQGLAQLVNQLSALDLLNRDELQWSTVVVMDEDADGQVDVVRIEMRNGDVWIVR